MKGAQVAPIVAPTPSQKTLDVIPMNQHIHKEYQLTLRWEGVLFFLILGIAFSFLSFMGIRIYHKLDFIEKVSFAMVILLTFSMFAGILWYKFGPKNYLIIDEEFIELSSLYGKTRVEWESVIDIGEIYRQGSRTIVIKYIDYNSKKREVSLPYGLLPRSSESEAIGLIYLLKNNRNDVIL